MKQRLRVFRSLVTLLMFEVFMDGGDCLPSGDPSDRLPAYTI